MRNDIGIDEFPLTYSKPSVIKETRAHFDSLLKKAANQGDENSTKPSSGVPEDVSSSLQRRSSENESLWQTRRKKKKNHRSSKQKLIDPDDDFSFTDEDNITSTEEVYGQEQISNDVIVHYNPGFTSDSDSKESFNKREDEERLKKANNSKNKKYLESNTSQNDSTSNNSSPSSSSLRNQKVQLVQSKSPSKQDTSTKDELWSSESNAEKLEDDDIIIEDEPSHPTPPPRTKKNSRRPSLTQRLAKLSSHFSQSTLSSHVSSEDSVQTAVRFSPTEAQEEFQDLPLDNEDSGSAHGIQVVGSRHENIELKPLTGWTPSYEEIDETTLSSRTADPPIRKSRADKGSIRKKLAENSIQSYDEIEDDSQNESERKKTKPKPSPATRENSSAKIKQKSNDIESDNSDEDDAVVAAHSTHYDYDQVLGILIHQCDRLQVDSLIIHPIVRIHIIDVSTGKYLKKSNQNRCYSYEEPSNIDYILPISTQPCNFPSLRSLTPMWEEMLVLNEDVQYITAEGMNVIILFEIIDFVSFEMASLQYKKLGSEAAGWHRIAWAFLKPVASNGSSNLNRRLRLQLFKPASEKRAKTSSEKCDVYQHWLKGARTRYPSTLHVTVQGVTSPSALPSPHSTLHPDVGIDVDVLEPSLGLQDQDSADEAGDQNDKIDAEQSKAKTPEEISWSRIPGQTCKVPNEKSLNLAAGNLGCFCLRFSPCGKFLAVDGANHNSHSLLVYGIPGGSLIKRFHGHQGLIYDLQWSAGSKFILSASADCTACVWDVGSALVKMIPHPSFVYCASFFPDDDQALLVVTGCCDQILRVWRRSDKHEDFQLAHELRGHEGFITSICVDEAGKFYSGDSEGRMRIWSHEGAALSLEREIKIRELSGAAISRLVPHPGGQRLLVHARDSTLRMINIATGSPIQWFNGALNHRLQTGATLSPCGRLVLSASEDGTFWVWNADTGKQLALYSDIIQRAANQKSVLPLSGTVDYHPHEHMAAFSVYGKHAPVVVCIYAKSASGRSVGLQLMTDHTKDESALLSNNVIRDWMKIKSKIPETDSSKDTIMIGREPTRHSSRSGKSYEGSLANIIQQMDEVIALTRRSNHSSDVAVATFVPATKTTPRQNELPQLTRVSERDSSRSSSSSSSIRRNTQQVKNEQHKIKRRHSGLQKSPAISEVAPFVASVASRKVNKSSSENSPNRINQHVISVSSIHSDSDSHIVDMSNVDP